MADGYDIFLSYNNADKPAVEYIARLIVNEGFQPWLDKWKLPAGQTWQDGIDLGLKNARSCAVFVGPAGFGKWQKEEIQTATNLRVAQGGFPVIPVILPGVKPDDLKALPAALTNTTWVKFTSLDDEDALAQLISGMVGRNIAVPAASCECPYRGLRFFDVEDRDYFHGREVLTNRLLEAIRPGKGGGSDNRFLGIVGPSGSGKSSVARAGLLAGIRAGAFPDSATWPIAICRPGNDPLESLANALLKVPGFQYGSKPGELEDDLANNPKTLLRATASLVQGAPDRRCIVFVDQLEEIFTLSKAEDRRAAFIDNLMHACTAPDGHVIAVLAIRGDFYDRCAAHKNLAAALSRPGCHFLVSSMNGHELEQAIVEPAHACGCRIAPQIVERLIQFAKGREGSLPLIEDMLFELWNRKTGNVIRVESYEEMGGVESALGKRAELTYQKLDGELRKTCERLFLRLVLLADNGAYVKRRAAMADLMPADATADEQQRIPNAVQILSSNDARLVVLGSEEEHPETGPLVEIVHEALIQSWNRLTEWLKTDRQFQFWCQRTGRAKDEWIRLNKDEDLLLRGPALAEAMRWTGERPRDLNRGEREFIDTSGKVQQRREDAEKQRQQALLDAQTNAARRAKRLMWAFGAVALLTLASAGSSYVALAQTAKANANRLAADARMLVDSDKNLAVLLALHAVRGNPAKLTWEALEVAVEAHGGRLVDKSADSELTAFAFDADGKRAASAHGDSIVRIWDLAERRIGQASFTSRSRKQELPHPAHVQSLAFSPKGDELATGGDDGIVRLWNIETGEKAFEFPAAGGAVMSLDFNRDGSRLAAAYFSGVVRVWQGHAAAPSEEYPHTGAANSISYHPARDSLAAGYADGAVFLLESGKARQIAKRDGKINSVKFNAQGRELAIASGDKALVCDPESCNAPREFGSDDLGAAGVAFDAAGQKLAMAGLSGTFAIFDAASKQELVRISLNQLPLNSVAFQPGSEKLAVASRMDGTVRVFELNREALRAAAREQVKDVHISAADCQKYLGGKDCGVNP